MVIYSILEMMNSRARPLIYGMKIELRSTIPGIVIHIIIIFLSFFSRRVSIPINHQQKAKSKKQKERWWGLVVLGCGGHTFTNFDNRG